MTNPNRIIGGLESIKENYPLNITEERWIDEAIDVLKKHKYSYYESRRKLPCVCGRKRLETWSNYDKNAPWSTTPTSFSIVCPECGRRATGNSKIGAIRAWNSMIDLHT